MGPNNLVSGLRGPNNIIFKDGQHIRFGFPNFKLGGTVMGDRSVETYGSCVYEDLTNHRKAVIIINTFKKTGWIKSSTTGCKDQFTGIIYECSKPLKGDKDSIKKNYEKDMDFVTDLKNLKDVKKQICEIEGSWLKHLKIGGKMYWDIESDIPSR
jgi:hypothetical protein